MTPPQWVVVEMALREAEARAAYESLKSIAPEAVLIPEDEYVRRYLNSLPDITWTRA